MQACGYMLSCKFIHEHMADKVALSDILRHKYCMGDHDSCARLDVCRALGGPEYVPIDLWPNDVAGAERAITRAQGAA